MTKFFGQGSGANPTVYPQAGRTELLKTFGALGFMKGAEVGVWKGGFSEEMCKVLPGLQLLCVDAWGGDPTYHEPKAAASWSKIRGQAERRLQPYGCIIDARLSVAAAADVPDGSLDFVYVDGNHGLQQVRADLESWVPKVRVGGIVAGHDYRDFPDRPTIQVKPAVDAFVLARGIREWFVLSREVNPSFLWVVS